MDFADKKAVRNFLKDNGIEDLAQLKLVFTEKSQPAPSQRSSTKPVSSVVLSFQERLTRVELGDVAARESGVMFVVVADWVLLQPLHHWHDAVLYALTRYV